MISCRRRAHTLLPRLNIWRGDTVYTHEDITQRRSFETEIARRAMQDPLTKLPNRNGISAAIRDMLSDNRSRSGSVLLLDLDGFKEVNDIHGHLVGDALLKLIAAKLREHCGTAALPARLGGDEFVVVINACIAAEGATALAWKIIDALENITDIAGKRVKVGVSIGIAMLDANTNTMDELLRRGDIALYRAKREGKGQCVVYKPAMDNEDAGLTASAIEEALRSDEFYLVYQPICDSATRQVRSVEALLRWRHPKRGLVGPSEFIPVAERSSVIHELGAWVLERACKDAASWPQDVQVAVNLSPKQFERPDQLRTAIRSALQTSGLRARRLIVEITESVLLQQDRSIEILQPIQDEGLTIALDDFGKGYASLDYLRRFRFDKLKIDRSFIADMATSAHCATIVSGILELSRRLGIHTVAEGVEASGQIAELCELGCSEVQGFAIGEPVRRDLVPTFFRLKAPDETSRQAN